MDLVEEVIEEILSRLPVKSLFRFKCVSKSWLSLISSEQFIKAHCQNSRKNRAVIFKGQGVILNQCSLQQLLDEPLSIKPCPIYDPTNNDLIKGLFGVVGCCNGLLCIGNKRGFHLWNPATMISMELPDLRLGQLGRTGFGFGFGWDGKSGACKVFVLNIHPKIYEIHVYSSNTNSWKKTIEHGHLGEFDESIGVFACGRVHWLPARGGHSIQSLDLESEEFGRIELPSDPPKFHNRTLAEIGGCLHLLCVDEHDDADADDQQSFAVIWVMKEKEAGWLKLVTLSLAFELRYLPTHPLFLEGPNGEILIIFRHDFLVYYPKDDAHVVRSGKMIIKFYCGHVYVESLVSPKLHASASISQEDKSLVGYFCMKNKALMWASNLSREYDGACLQMRLSYSPFAHIFMFLVQLVDCHLASALGLIRILIYKAYEDGKTTVSVSKRKASLREFYGVIFPSLLQLHRGITDVEERKQMEICATKYRRRDEMEKDDVLSEIEIEREEECGICMEMATKVVLPNCSHSLCTKCYTNWRARSQSCPFCRDSLKRVNSGELWIYTSTCDIVDLSAIARENMKRLMIYIDKLPLVDHGHMMVSYDPHIR